jgi:hypothetical protein
MIHALFAAVLRIIGVSTRTVSKEELLMKRILLTLTVMAAMALCTGCWGGAPEPTAAPTLAPTPTLSPTLAPTMSPEVTAGPVLPTEGATQAAPAVTAGATSEAAATAGTQD